MFTTNPFSILAESVPPIALQSFVIAMVLLVIVGTLIDIIHKKNVKYFFENARKAKLSATKTLSTGEKISVVSKKHCLVVPKRHVKSYFDLSEKEILSCNQLIIRMKTQIEEKDETVKGFNVGTNCGKVAGQSIMHCHIHLIPRREVDDENPQGGVRSVIPLKQYYVRKP